jgi:hypothetical protein
LWQAFQAARTSATAPQNPRENQGPLLPDVPEEIRPERQLLAHAFTHVHRPDKKDGRNKKISLRHVISVVSDLKQIDKLLKDWNTEVKSDYRPEDEEDDSPLFMEEIKKAHPDFDFLYDADEACLKIAYHRMGQ